MTSFGVDVYKASEQDLIAEGVAGREKSILSLDADILPDYGIVRKLKMETPMKNALKRLEYVEADLGFIYSLKSRKNIEKKNI
jgi:ABC-type molybdate transport system substrate-binding protein